MTNSHQAGPIPAFTRERVQEAMRYITNTLNGDVMGFTEADNPGVTTFIQVMIAGIMEGNVIARGDDTKVIDIPSVVAAVAATTYIICWHLLTQGHEAYPSG